MKNFSITTILNDRNINNTLATDTNIIKAIGDDKITEINEDETKNPKIPDIVNITPADGEKDITVYKSGEALLTGQDISTTANVTETEIEYNGIVFTGAIRTQIQNLISAELFDRYAKLRKGMALWEIKNNGLADGIFTDKKGNKIVGEPAYRKFLSHFKINRTNALRWRTLAEYTCHRAVGADGNYHLIELPALMLLPEPVIVYAQTQGISPLHLAAYASSQTIIPRNTAEFAPTYNAFAKKHNAPQIEDKSASQNEDQSDETTNQNEDQSDETTKTRKSRKSFKNEQSDDDNDKSTIDAATAQFIDGDGAHFISISNYSRYLPIPDIESVEKISEYLERKLPENITSFRVIPTNDGKEVKTIAEANSITIVLFAFNSEYSSTTVYTYYTIKRVALEQIKRLQQAQQPKDEQPKDEQPKDEQPTDEQPTDEQPTDEQSTDEQPVGEQPTSEQGEQG